MTTTSDLTGFREWFDEEPFNALGDSQINRALTEALLIHDKNPLATLYCAAHLLALDADSPTTLAADGGAGVITQERIGPKSLTYKTQVNGRARDAFFATSKYGRRFLLLEQRTPRSGIGAMVF